MLKREGGARLQSNSASESYIVVKCDTRTCTYKTIGRSPAQLTHGQAEVIPLGPVQ